MDTGALRHGRRLKDIQAFIGDVFAHDLHAKRVFSLASATLGMMIGATLAVAMIGQALAQARGLLPKHAIKQVDRLLSNRGIDVWGSFAHWVPHLVTRHGRAQPLLWLTVWKKALSKQRNNFEYARLGICQPGNTPT